MKRPFAASFPYLFSVLLSPRKNHLLLAFRGIREDDVTFAGPLPRDVLYAIVHSDGIHSPVSKKTAIDADTMNRFVYKDIHLGFDGERDLVVRGTFPFTGADNEWFWLVRMLPKGPRAVLWIGTDPLKIQRTRDQGLARILSTRCSPNECKDESFRFTGRTYRKTVERWRKNTQVGR